MGQDVDAVNGMMYRADIGEEHEWSILNALTNGVAENFLERVWGEKWDV